MSDNNVDQFNYIESGILRYKRELNIKKFDDLTKKSSRLFFLGGDLISSEPLTTGNYEPHIKSTIDFLAQTGNADFLIDIGANIGLTSCQSGEKFKEVHMFEPNPICYNVLKSNCMLSLKDKCNYKIYEYGLGKTEQTVSLTIPRKNLGGAFVKNSHNSYSEDLLAKKDGFKIIEKNNYFSETIQLKSSTEELSRLLEELKSKNLKSGVIKIDVEGYELIVLEGLSALPKNMNLYIIFESWDEDLNLANLKDHLKIDFSVYKIKTVRQYRNIFVRLLKKISRIFSPDLIYRIYKCPEKCGSGDIIVHIES